MGVAGGATSADSCPCALQEDAILQQLRKDSADYVNHLAEEEVKRNRGRVLEILRYMGNEQEDMEMMEENYGTTEN